MKTKLVRQTARVIEGDGVNTPELTMGYIEIERRFKVYKDGHERLDESFQERITTIDDMPVNYNWSKTALDEFYPGWSTIEVI